MDVQAQDRAHRIGQTKPVLIFRLVSAHTIETKILQRASEKRQLEALVIAKGKFKMPSLAATLANGPTKKETMAEMAASLLRLEGEKIEVVPETKEGKKAVLSDEDLEMLLDRSPEVFNERGEGWISSREAKTTVMGEAGNGQLDHGSIGGGRKAAFVRAIWNNSGLRSMYHTTACIPNLRSVVRYRLRSRFRFKTRNAG
jgi:ATP-dependent DNA helicase